MVVGLQKMRTSSASKELCGLRVLALVAIIAMVATGCAGPARGSTRGAASTTHSPKPASPGTTGSPPVSPTNTVAPPGLSFIVEPQAGMTPIYNFMSSAKQSLEMTMYELSDPQAEQILIADHHEGVRVQVLLDRDYSGGSVNQAAYSALSAAGVPVAWAAGSEIFHQKTITVDGAQSAIMTGNLTSQYYATTRDFVIMDSQAADVSAIESVFASDWSGANPSPGPMGADLVWSPGSEPQLVALIGSAQRSVEVENEEMDSSAIEGALEDDASRGVTVTVIMTSDSDWDSAFSRLESTGVNVVLYPDTSSTLYIHAKVIDVDNAKAFVGSENFSTDSLDYNRELGVITSSTSVLGPLSGSLSSDIANGQEQQRTNTAPPATSATTPSAQTPTPTADAGCSPIDDEGGCYEPGEYCRDDDHGTTGRAGNGRAITCGEDNGAWYWESS
jgi:cardiolipin synthase